MSYAICTLFENHYHHGVAVLTNSLFRNGFRGSIYAGYRGKLPAWADSAADNPSLNWENAKTLKVADGLELHFLPIITHYHLTNFKPNFMLSLLEGPAKSSSGMVYFDPDIIVKCKSSYFEDWIGFGIALVHEIISNDMPATHPLRKQWEAVILKAGKQVARNNGSYINGGFCGVHVKHKAFLQDWIDITNTGMKYFGLTADQWDHNHDRTYMFASQDQDTLNIAAMSTECPISEMGPEAMDFIHGGFTMSHAVGSPKPWKKTFLAEIIKGNRPSNTDKLFWGYAGYPIKTFDASRIATKKASISIASLVGRFYSQK